MDEDTGPSESNIPPREFEDTEINIRDPRKTAIVNWIVFLVGIFQTKFHVTDTAIEWLLLFIAAIFKALSIFTPSIGEIAKALPRTLYMLRKHMTEVSPDYNSFEKRIACQKCFTMYTYGECLGPQPVIYCSFKPFHRSQKCGARLLRQIVSSSGKPRHYPISIYCFKRLKATLQMLVSDSSFLEVCEYTRKQVFLENSVYRDVHDGKLWRELSDPDGTPFLSKPYRYGLLLNVDWFQPFKHVMYSVGVMFITILNLPREERFKIKNVILVGIIPGPKEPSLTMNSLLAPLVSDLLDLWEGVSFRIASGGFAEVRCALLGVSCDIPAGRKVCGFLGHSANLGCTRCLQNFSSTSSHRDYSNFNRDSWPERTNQQHRSDVDSLKQFKTQTDRAQAELKLGCRYSALLDLPYFNPVRMLLIDPMHNLFLGTSKHVARDIWIGRDVLSQTNLHTIRQRLEKFTIPSDMGRLPVTIAPGTFLTAEQWKTWTLYLSIYCLHNLLPTEHLECWRHFVLACRRLCTFEITSTDLKVSDALFLRFCKRFFQLYGKSALTPNIHLHCHLTSCVEDFGPLHCFWLFPYERYNGVLGQQPTNNKSVELQLMRRFLRDRRNLRLTNQCESWSDADIFKSLLSSEEKPKETCAVISSTKYIRCSLCLEDVTLLTALYQKRYPELSQQFCDQTIYVPSTFKKFSCLQRKGKRLESAYNKNTVSYVVAEPLFRFTTSDAEEFDGVLRPAKVEYFLEHSVQIAGELRHHLFAAVSWPMVHPQRFKIGKPVEIWCNNLYEPSSQNSFLPIESIQNRAIFTVDRVDGEQVLIVIPVLE